ncbi:MAG: SpoIIE family protein phosphatase [Bacteroidales bacterium]|nr:SpoIIE family protein phosphatase [Bacteroidales bacterium]
MGRRKHKITTIYKQLIYNVVIPAIIALLALGILNYVNTKKLLSDSNENTKSIIFNEIKNILELQDLSLEILEENLDKRMHELSSSIVFTYLNQINNPEACDLYKLQKELGMDPDMEDIYIINSQGIIVNTTFKADSGLNLFSFGEEHKRMLLNVLKGKKFVSERFTIEASTKRLKKYTYQPTVDGNYIVEIGIYSEEADKIIEFIKNRLNTLTSKQETVQEVDLFIGQDNPFSLNKQADIQEHHRETLAKVFLDKKARSIEEKVDKRKLVFDYLYMERENTDLYKGSVIRITSDRTNEIKTLRGELFKVIGIFITALIGVVFLLYKKTKVITDPIKKLVDSVIRISGGHFNERVELLGNNEITKLSEKFNIMIEQLESYYNELEQKVKERTAEIVQQKEEIEAQRDTLEEQRNMLAEINEHLQKAYNEIDQQKKHITDSIYYARRIQNAILPPKEYVQELLPNSFIFYKPKDIVSGDFYWFMKKDDKIMFAAVDCTGHGVPGAFMSIVGHNQLNYSVNVKNASKPSDILDELNLGVTGTLRQTRGKSNVKDGMDISLCVYETKKKRIQFAAAYRPFILIRDDEIIEIKGDKFPIGAFVDEELKNFENHELEVKEGDMIYMFSDGYPDQFGGEDGGKFLIKKFRQLLFDIHKKPVEEQRVILEESFYDWKGSLEQVDDILVIGVKI